MTWTELAEMPAKVVEAFFKGLADVEKSVGTKGIIAVVLTSTAGAAVLYEIPMPDWYVTACMMVITLYFGGSLAMMKPE